MQRAGINVDADERPPTSAEAAMRAAVARTHARARGEGN